MKRCLVCLALLLAAASVRGQNGIESGILSSADPFLQSVLAGAARQPSSLQTAGEVLQLVITHCYAGLQNPQPATQQVASQLAGKYTQTLQVNIPPTCLDLQLRPWHDFTVSAYLIQCDLGC